MGLEKDLPPGEQLVTLFRPFLNTWQCRICPEDDPEARRQHVGIRRRVHHRTQLHAFAQKNAGGEVLADMIKDGGPFSITVTPRNTAILRVYLPKAVEIPQSITGLNVGRTTHRFPGRGIFVGSMIPC